MFHWGTGPALGLLTFLGNSVFFLGCIYLWRCRAEISLWMEDEFSAFRRNLSRFEPAGSFYLPRSQSRLLVIPAGFLHSVGRLPRRRFPWGLFLVFLGALLFALDFFI
jgi:hypothetical protein